MSKEFKYESVMTNDLEDSPFSSIISIMSSMFSHITWHSCVRGCSERGEQMFKVRFKSAVIRIMAERFFL